MEEYHPYVISTMKKLAREKEQNNKKAKDLATSKTENSSKFNYAKEFLKLGANKSTNIPI